MLLVHTALMCEAKPLVKDLRLESLPLDGSVRLYAAGDTALVVSGVGRVRAGAAIGFAMAHLREKFEASPFLLNAGVCGSADEGKMLGHTFLVRKCTDASSGRSYYSDFLFSHALPEADLHTFDRVVQSRRELLEEAPGCQLVDMEAMGVFEAASLFLPPSRVMCLKVVGDFLEDARAVTAQAVEKRVKMALPEIRSFMEAYRRFAARAQPEPVLNAEDERTLRKLQEGLRLTQAQHDRLADAARFSRLSKQAPLAERLRPFLAKSPQHKRERGQVFQRLLEVLHGK